MGQVAGKVRLHRLSNSFTEKCVPSPVWPPMRKYGAHQPQGRWIYGKSLQGRDTTYPAHTRTTPDAWSNDSRTHGQVARSTPTSGLRTPDVSDKSPTMLPFG